jgi:5-(carboxyamino)imidazole ribonucleotide synthase
LVEFTEDPPIVGIIGGGQLGRMLALAGLPLGLRFRFLEPKSDAPVRSVGPVIHAEYDDPEALDTFRAGLTVVTYEFENVPADAVRRIQSTVPIHPAPAALAVAQDRLAEKETFRRLAIPTPAFRAVNERSELETGAADLGFPCVLKTRRMGYDGKGQRVLRGAGDLDSAWEALGRVPLLLESFVRFTRELSVLGVRGMDGETLFYPLAQNEHREGILRTSHAPVPGLDPTRQNEAEGIASRLLEELEYVGVLAIELFETSDGLLANELAPRVHNSGHWTQDGAVTSQFENHLRAILGLPLGSPEPRGWTAMVNLLGTAPERSRILALPGAHLHLYDKPPQPGRKLGHVNLVASTPGELESKVALLVEVVGGE